MYRAICFLIDVFLPLVSRIEVHNLDRLPRSGGYIAASNHLGRLDVPLVYYFLDRDDVILIVAEKYQKYAIYRWLARQLNAIFIDRSNADVSTLREILKRLKQGGVLAVAPEGTRSKTHALIEGRPGVSYMAVKADLPIIPVGATGTEDAVVKARWLHLKRPHVIVRVGEPFRLPPLDKRDREAALKKNTDEIMCRIAALLPESYRGVYADHPRLRELLQERNLHTSASESREN
jgi:1-acyl-sn-glycerol-3-phosphate acyltransferase